MRAIEFQAHIDPNGSISIPEEFHDLFGKQARFVVLIPDEGNSTPSIHQGQRKPGSAKGILTVIEDDEGIDRCAEGHRT